MEKKLKYFDNFPYYFNMVRV